MRKRFGCRKWKAFTFGDILGALILTILAKNPTHGYSILEELKKIGIDVFPIHHTVVYRMLRMMEMEGFLESSWEIGEGPPRRIYKITSLGREYLKNWYIGAKEDLKLMEKIIRDIEENILKEDK